MIYRNAMGDVATQISWTAPSEQADGTAYGDAEHAGYELGVIRDEGITPHVSVPAAYAVTDWPLDQLELDTEGQHEVALRTVDTDGRTSAWSASVLFTSELAGPNAPTGLLVS